MYTLLRMASLGEMISIGEMMMCDLRVDWQNFCFF